MTQGDLINVISGDSRRITDAISTGAGWEVWMQVELALLLRSINVWGSREVKYPGSNQYLDFLAQDNHGVYAIELKVESATNSGVNFLPSVQSDINKIISFTSPNLVARCVIGIGYSSVANNAMRTLANTNPNNCMYLLQGSIGVLVVNVL